MGKSLSIEVTNGSLAAIAVSAIIFSALIYHTGYTRGQGDMMSEMSTEFVKHIRDEGAKTLKELEAQNAKCRASMRSLVDNHRK